MNKEYDVDSDLDERKINKAIEEELADAQPEVQAENQFMEKNK